MKLRTIERIQLLSEKFPLPWRVVTSSLIDANGGEITRIDNPDFAYFLMILSEAIHPQLNLY